MTQRETLPCVVLCTEYPLADKGGVSVVVSELARGLATEFSLVLVSPDFPGSIDVEATFPGLKAHIPFQLGALPPSPAFARQAEGLVERLKKEHVRIAHFHCGGVFGWGNRWPGPSIPEHFTRAGIKTLFTNHSTELSSRAFSAPGRPRWISDLLAPVGKAGKVRQTGAVDVEVAVSAHNCRFFEQHYPCSGHEPMVIYHSRLDEVPPHVPSKRQARILAVGQVAYRKGQDILASAFLEIAGRFPDWEVDIVGHDTGDGCWQAIEKMKSADPNGSRIHLRGLHDQPAEMMSTASIFVQPSREEALGLALQEALFCGCPAIGSKIGGIPEVIDEGQTGLLVPGEDSAALAEALSRMISDEHMRNQMGSQAPAAILAKGMTRRGMIAAHSKLYRSLLAA